MSLQEKLDRRQFVVTIEIQPAMDEGIYQLLNDMNCIKGRVDCMNVPEFKKPSQDIDSMVTGKALVDEKYETIYQTTTRRKHRPNLETDLLKAHQIGIQNVLVFSEDYSIGGASEDEKMFFHVDSAKLFSVLGSLKDGRDVKGKDLTAPVNFCLGSGVNAGGKKIGLDERLREMEQMVEQGTRFFQTSPVFDLDEFRDFVRIVEPFGVSILAGVMLLRTGEMARFVQKQLGISVPDWIIDKMTRAPYKLNASIEIFAELVNGLRDMCQGIHIIPLGWYDKLPMFFDEARL
jgi:methylenetetrahydrofolate reductase (NADH)